MTTLDLVCLRSLVAVASFAGVRRAAETLQLSPPAVSGHLRRLEAELGFPIVARRGRSISFTTRGEEVLREAHQLLAAHDDAVDRLAIRDDAVLTIASTEQASEPMVRAVAHVLTTKYPRRSIRLRFHRTARIREVIHEHAADVALGFGDLGPGTVPVGDVPLNWFGAVDARPNTKALVAFSAPCVVRDRMLNSDIAAQATISRECVDLTSLLAAVRDRVGITALPTFLLLAGIAPMTELPALPTVPLTLATGPRIDDDCRSALLIKLRAAWVDV